MMSYCICYCHDAWAFSFFRLPVFFNATIYPFINCFLYIKQLRGSEKSLRFYRRAYLRNLMSMNAEAKEGTDIFYGIQSLR